HFDLPDSLHARGGIDADGILDEVRFFDSGHLALPDIEIGEMRAGSGRQGRRRGKVWLLVVGNRSGAAPLRQDGVETYWRRPMVFSQETMDIDSPRTNRQLARGERDLETIRRFLGDDGPPDDVDRLRPEAPVKQFDQLIPVGIKL